MIASAHGGVLPWCAHGSSVTYSVAPRARPPACAQRDRPRRAPRRSARGILRRRSSPPATTTAPTIGFGAVCPHPSSASASARCMYCRSSPRRLRRDRAAGSFTRYQPKRSPTEPYSRESIVRVRPRTCCTSSDRAAGHLADFADELEQRQIEREIGEHVRCASSSASSRPGRMPAVDVPNGSVASRSTVADSLVLVLAVCRAAMPNTMKFLLATTRHAEVFDVWSRCDVDARRRSTCR